MIDIGQTIFDVAMLVLTTSLLVHSKVTDRQIKRLQEAKRNTADIPEELLANMEKCIRSI